MEEMILREGVVLPGGVLNVGSFLNQCVDTGFLKEIGKEVARLYEGEHVTKVLTVEASGITIATAVAMEMGIPMLFAKKHKTSNVNGEVYSTKVHSFTNNIDYNMVVSKDYLLPQDHCLLVDDFLANGAALKGLIELVHLSGATLAGAAIAIEKVFQGGGDSIRSMGVRVESLGKIVSMTDDGSIVFE